MKGETLSLRQQLRVDRSSKDAVKMALVLGAQFALKQNMLTWGIIFPRVIFPSTFETEEAAHVYFEARSQRRVECANAILTQFQSLAREGHTPSTEGDINVTKKLLKAQSSNAAVNELSTYLKNEGKPGQALKGVPPIVKKQAGRAAFDLPLNVGAWAPAFMCTPFLKGSLKEIHASDKFLMERQDELDNLSRRDLLELALARGFGHESASNQELSKQLSSWLALAKKGDEEGWDPVRSRLLFMGANVVQSIRQDPPGELHRALFSP